MNPFAMAVAVFSLSLSSLDSRASEILLPDSSTYESELNTLLQDLKIPGLAVAVVHNDKIVFQKGFGFRNVERQLPVTENTLFAVGSTTKAFTATLAGILVDQGILDWEAPVRQYLPAFELKDPVATQQATLVDLMSHRTGLPRHDLVWYGYDNFPREYFVGLLKFLEPSKPFRQNWQYNNFMWMVSGAVLESVTQSTYEDLLKRRLLDPLEMQSTNLTVEEMEGSPDFATPYVFTRDGSLRPTPQRAVIGMSPAGAINSNLVDFAKWLRFNLNLGSDSPNLITAKTLKKIQSPHMLIGNGVDLGELKSLSYGLGWRVQHYKGLKLISHDGGIDGFIAHIGFIPEKNIGVIAFMNTISVNLPETAALLAYDKWLNLTPSPHAENLRNQFRQLTETSQARKTKKETSQYQNLNRPPHDFHGKYKHPAYGEIEIESAQPPHAAHSLNATYHNMHLRLAHLRHGAFEIVNDDPNTQEYSEGLKAVFQIDEEGKILALEIKLEPAVGPIRFQRLTLPSASQ